MARITGGVARGRVLEVQVGPGIRPTSERAREALFSILGQDLDGCSVLDAFGGTGLLGIEAWSRGAAVTVVEVQRRAVQDIQRRAALVGAHPPAFDVRCGDVCTLAPNLGSFAGVLADPPWKEAIEPILAVLGGLARDWLVLEADVENRAPDVAGRLVLDRVRTYGRTAFWVYRAPE
jgi:16S rRNA (guanine966-N2)-methyltransferase